MKITKLAKDQNSGGNGCPAVYLGETGELVIQGVQVDIDTFGRLDDVLPGETAVRISSDVVVRAVELYLARAGGE
ncbi:hypothetical protein ACFFQW_32585 [Umezawaea endophytica]|uniref:Uncharacterized protein n=1 Tax=Umezawaea endophytica TaxID=1654476 RepID=A0A9X2VXB8_9PSEU|nr:hypothetical protein [Umezawaea endophytica]MCS7483877.1 hypothetical protein [Umezawaea endophytica]